MTVASWSGSLKPATGRVRPASGWHPCPVGNIGSRASASRSIARDASPRLANQSSSSTMSKPARSDPVASSCENSSCILAGSSSGTRCARVGYAPAKFRSSTGTLMLARSKSAAEPAGVLTAFFALLREPPRIGRSAISSSASRLQPLLAEGCPSRCSMRLHRSGSDAESICSRRVGSPSADVRCWSWSASISTR